MNLEEDIHSKVQCLQFVSWGNRVYLCVGEGIVQYGVVDEHHETEQQLEATKSMYS